MILIISPMVQGQTRWRRRHKCGLEFWRVWDLFWVHHAGRVNEAEVNFVLCGVA
jgi:hypothetical protein